MIYSVCIVEGLMRRERMAKDFLLSMPLRLGCSSSRPSLMRFKFLGLSCYLVLGTILENLQCATSSCAVYGMVGVFVGNVVQHVNFPRVLTKVQALGRCTHGMKMLLLGTKLARLFWVSLSRVHVKAVMDVNPRCFGSLFVSFFVARTVGVTVLLIRTGMFCIFSPLQI